MDDMGTNSQKNGPILSRSKKGWKKKKGMEPKKVPQKKRESLTFRPFTDRLEELTPLLPWFSSASGSISANPTNINVPAPNNKRYETCSSVTKTRRANTSTTPSTANSADRKLYTNA